jgi:hypothetical protein
MRALESAILAYLIDVAAIAPSGRAATLRHQNH